MDNHLPPNDTDQVPHAGADEEDDSDFGDFGGFEAAEPIPMSATEQENISAQWAVYTAGQGSLRPDLLCAQNAFPPCLDPSDIAGGDAGRDQPPLFEADFHLDETLRQNGFPPDPAGLAENPPNVSRCIPLRLASPRGQSSQASGQSAVGAVPLPDLGIGTVGLGAAMPEPHWPVSDIVPNESITVHPGPPPAAPLASAADESRRHVDDDVDANESQPVSAEQDVLPLPEAVENVSSGMKKDLENLEAENARLQQELAQTQELLERQRARLEEVQTKHDRDLDEVRKAGHDALAVVVEQYKELSRTAVLEQQQTSLLQVQEKLQSQSEIFQHTLESQAEELKKLHQDEMAQSERSLHEALERSRLEQQEKFDAFLKEESEKQKTALQQALEAEREQSKELLEAAILEERRKTAKMLEEEREKFSQSLQSMREDCKKEIEKAIEEERKKSKELLEEELKVSKEKCQEAVKETQEAAKCEMTAYVQEQRQADSLVRQRHLSTLDLFLDSARRQIGLLLETEASRTVDDSKSDSAQSNPRSDSEKPGS